MLDYSQVPASHLLESGERVSMGPLVGPLVELNGSSLPPRLSGDPCPGNLEGERLAGWLLW